MLSDKDLTDLESRLNKSAFLKEKWTASFVFLASRGCPHSCAHGPLSPSSKPAGSHLSNHFSLVITLFDHSLEKFSELRTHCDNNGSSKIIQYNFPISKSLALCLSRPCGQVHEHIHRILGFGCAHLWWRALFCLLEMPEDVTVPALPYFLCLHRLLPLPGTLSSAFPCLCFVFQAWMFLLYGYFGIFRSSLSFSFFPLCNTYHNYYISICLSMHLLWCWLPSGTASSVKPGTMFSSTATWYHSPGCSTWEWIHPWFIEDYELTKISFKFKYKNTNLVLKVWLKPTP